MDLQTDLAIKIRNTLSDSLKTMKPNGSVLIALKNDVIYEEFFGFSDIEKKIPTTLHTEYLVGSVTKQFTAAALLHALYVSAKEDSIPENELDANIKAALQKTIANYLPKDHEIWANAMPEWAERVTLHHLLVHSSGIPNYTSMPHYDQQQSLYASDLITFFKNQPLEFALGTQFSYSNSGYFLLGIIIQEISNQPLDRYLQTVFFEPLNMHSSFLPTRGTVDELKQSDVRFTHLARGYTLDIAAIHPEIIEVDNYTSMQIPGAAGGLISTTRDLLKWNSALFAGKIIPPFLFNLMLQSYIQSEKVGEYYGYGIEIKNSQSFGKYYRHPGGIPGFKSRLTYIPQWQLTIIILENVYGHQNSLLPEIEVIKSRLPATLSEAEKVAQIAQILEANHPDMIANRKCYQLTLLEDCILAILEDF